MVWFMKYGKKEQTMRAVLQVTKWRVRVLVGVGGLDLIGRIWDRSEERGKEVGYRDVSHLEQGEKRLTILIP